MSSAVSVPEAGPDPAVVTDPASTVAPVSARVRVTPADLPLDSLDEVEVSWPDQFGHALGKRLPVDRFAQDAVGHGVTFCNGTLAWNVLAEVQEGSRYTNCGTGYPDAFAVPDLSTFRLLPWRDRVGHVVADVVDHDRRPARTSPRAVLRRVLDHLAETGYTAQVGVELEFYLLRPDGTLPQDGVHCYSLEKANELEPALGTIIEQLRRFVPVEAANTEYGPGQVEVNLRHADALTAADDAFRLKYAVRELARREGLLATFMAKPFSGLSGSSSHLHVSLWQDGRPAFAPEEGAEAATARHAVAGLLGHLPGITLFGAPTVNSYKRYEAASFAPTSASWGGDNRTVAVRSLVESPAASRVELRTPAADANPYWTIAAALAAVSLGVRTATEPPQRASGDQYGVGTPLPATLPDAIAATLADEPLGAVLGEDAVHDLAVLARSEWTAYTTEVTQWERDRYLRRA